MAARFEDIQHYVVGQSILLPKAGESAGGWIGSFDFAQGEPAKPATLCADPKLPGLVSTKGHNPIVTQAEGLVRVVLERMPLSSVAVEDAQPVRCPDPQPSRRIFENVTDEVAAQGVPFR
jgi:hypothetical protein